MAKKSQRLSVRYEKDKSGCMWSFISMFDFRRGHSTRKLIADKRRSNKHAAATQEGFIKKAKSQSKSSTNENWDTDSSNRIVLLKPGPIGLQNYETGNNLTASLDSHDTAQYHGPSVRGSSHFSLTEINKKLKHVMGRERHENLEGISKKYPAECQNEGTSGKAIGKDNVGMRSPNKDHFFIEKIARPTSTGGMKGDKTGNGDDNIDSSSRQISKTLGRILSLPEYNFSPLGSPGRDWEHHFMTSQRRFSALDKISEAKKDNLSPKQEISIGHLDQETDNPVKQPSICEGSSNNKVLEIQTDSNFSDDLSHIDKAENNSPGTDEIVTEVVVESAKVINVLESSSKPIGLSAGKEDQNSDTSEIHSQCLKQDVTEENQALSPLSTPSHSSTAKKIKEVESVKDVSGRSSPVSVLEVPFLEDDFSPENSRFQPVEVPIRPLHIQFEEQDSSPLNQIDRAKYCTEENELIYDYFQAVLQASGLTRDQLLMKCLSSDKILDPSLFDQVEFLSNQLCHDKKLLFECINEILMEVCCKYFGATPYVWFVNPRIRLTQDMKRVILKVWEGVCWQLLPLPSPHTLDKIVRKDMEKSGGWMDLQFEAETVGFEIGEAILAKLMEDTILSCVGRSPESECDSV